MNRHDGPETRWVVARASAGDGDGSLDAIDGPVGSSAPDRGPTGLVLETRELQVIHDIESDPSVASWRAAALERGFRSSAAYPLEYDDLDGVLTLYAPRA